LKPEQIDGLKINEDNTSVEANTINKENKSLIKNETFKMRKINFNAIRITIFIVLVILLIPSAVSYLMERTWMNFGTQKAESWMSFWGGYLGAFIGLLAVIYTTNKQIKSSRNLMIEQLENQTKQIEISANIHDNLEKQRIYLNTILEKNLEIQKKIKELEDVFFSHKSVFSDLISVMEEFYEIQNKVRKLKSKIKLEDSTGMRPTVNPYYDKVLEKCAALNNQGYTDYLKKELVSNNEIMNKTLNISQNFSEKLEKKINDIITLKIFINSSDQYQKNDTYENKLSEVIKFIQDLVQFITMLMDSEVHKKKEEKESMVRRIEQIDKESLQYFKDLNFQSEVHIKSILERFYKNN